MVFSLALDLFGLLGFERVRPTQWRLSCVALTLGGVLMMQDYAGDDRTYSGGVIGIASVAGFVSGFM
jgi:hypothetical protein